MTSATDRDLASSLAPIISANGLFLEGVELKGPHKHRSLEVIVDLPDGPGGVTDTQLSEVTRAISDALDEIDPINEAYELMVTTPGIERPLTTNRHFQRAIGHIVHLERRDGEDVEGTLIDADDQVLTCECEGAQIRVERADIVSAHMVAAI